MAALDRRQLLAGVGAVALLPVGEALMSTAGTFAADRDFVMRQLRVLLGAFETRDPRETLTDIGRLMKKIRRMREGRLNPEQNADTRWMLSHLLTVRGCLRHQIGDPLGLDDADRALRLATGVGSAELGGAACRILAGIHLFDGHPELALAAAQDGQSRAVNGPMYAACAAEEARALGALPGDHQEEVRRAVDRALAAAGDLPVSAIRPPGLYFDGWSPVQALYIAAQAHAGAGNLGQATKHADIVTPLLDAAGLPDLQAQARLSLAAAYARTGRLELDRVCRLAGEALDHGRHTQRLESSVFGLMGTLAQHHGVPEVRRLRARVQEWAAA